MIGDDHAAFRGGGLFLALKGGAGAIAPVRSGHGEAL